MTKPSTLSSYPVPAKAHLEPVEIYLANSPLQDPVFKACRKKYYGHSGNKDTWLELAGWHFQRSPARLGPISHRALEPAIGWEFRSTESRLPVREEGWQKLVSSLCRHKAWDVCHLTNLTAGEAWELREVCERYGHAVRFQPFPVRYIRNEGGYEGYMASRSRDRIRANSYRARQAKKVGAVFNYELQWQQIENLLDRKRAKSDDYTRQPRFRAYLRELRFLLKRENRFHETGLFVKDKLVAYDVGFWIGGVFHSYQCAFDPELSYLSPGRLAFDKTLEFVLEQNTDLVNLTGDFEYFSFFTEDKFELQRATVFSRSVRAWFLRKACALLAG